MTPEAADDGEAPGRARFAALVAIAVALATLPRVLLHEPWRDEAWYWLVARESATPAELFAGLEYNGHGYLYPLICWLAAQFSHSVVAAQVLQPAIVGAAAWLVARHAPFRRLECVLIVLGYFTFYEYAVFARHYGFGMLFVFLACVAARRDSPLVFGFALSVLFQTTIYGYILALAIGAGHGVQRFTARDRLPPLAPGAVLAGGACALFGAVAGLVQFSPPPDVTFAAAWRFGWDPGTLVAALRGPWCAFFPVPMPGIRFWNTDLLASWPLARAIASVAVLGLAGALLWHRKLALAVFALAVAGLLAFAYAKLFGSMRHHGHIWLAFLAGAWLAGGLADGDGRRTLRERVFLALLVVHVVVAAWASAVDWRHPFSNGANAARLLQSRGLHELPLIGYREPPAGSVSLPLERPMYAASRGTYRTRIAWDPLQRDVTWAELRCAAHALARREGRDAVLVLNNVPFDPWPELVFEGEVTGAIEASEDFRIYRIPLGATAAPPPDCGPVPAR